VISEIGINYFDLVEQSIKDEGHVVEHTLFVGLKIVVFAQSVYFNLDAC
jgi:hypothetical protein